MSIVVSVVVPVLNAEATLGECLNALTRQNLARASYEVIVVDGRSADSSAEIAANYPVRMLVQPNKGAGDARNIGWRAAKGAWIAFTDADCIPSRTWLSRLLHAAQASEDSFGAAGKTIGYESNTSPARFADLIGTFDSQRYLSHPEFPWAPTANVMYGSKALEVVGGFDPRYTSYEGCDLHTRLRREVGGAFPFEPLAVVFHRHRRTWVDYWIQQYSYGKGYAQFVRRYADDIRWSIGRELKAWAEVGALGVRALSHPWRKEPSVRTGSDNTIDGDESLLRRGMFVKSLAQRAGFVSTYWNPVERSRW